METQVAVVGGGVAGLTSALFLLRKGINTTLISEDIGGQTISAISIENYPAIDKITGYELINRLYNQVKKLGLNFIQASVMSIKKETKFKLYLSTGQHVEASAVILAIGKIPRRLGAENEEVFLGKGVFYSIIGNEDYFKDKEVIVIGGGNSALESTLYLSNISKKITIVHRSPSFRADEITIKKIKNTNNIEVLFNTVCKKFIGDKKLEAVLLNQNGSEFIKHTNAVLINIGFIYSTKWLKDFVNIDDKGSILVDELCRTSQPGVFAAGDCTQLPYKQITTSIGQATIAAFEAYKYITNTKGFVIDWH